MPFPRLTSPSIVATITSAFVAVLLIVEPARAAWRPPVDGAVARAFDPGRQPFEGGRHRGVDLAAPPGSSVRAPCAGEVVFAGAVGANGRVVTLRCGPWRVTHLPLATVTARAGATVDRGDRLGTVEASPDHHGLHLGVRREGERFGYADPLRFLAPERATPPPLGPAPRPARPRPTPPPLGPAPRPAGPRLAPPPLGPAPRPARPRPARPTARPPTPHDGPAARRRRAPRAAPGSSRGVEPPLAPWPAWLGTALVLGGAGLRLRARMPSIRGRAPAPVR